MDLTQYFRHTVPMVNRRIHEIVDREPGRFRFMLKRAVRGGKRLRPILCQLVSDALGGDAKKALTCGAIVELTHNGSLVLDDFLDWDVSRRGAPPLWRVVGSSRSLFGSLFSFTTCMRLSSEMGAEATRMGSSMLGELLEGGTLNLVLKEANMKEYLNMIDKKTATLFKYACEFGALSAGASAEVRKRFRWYGREIGMAYQLCDDLTSFWASSPGDLKEDFRNRQINYVMLAAYRGSEQILTTYLKGNGDMLSVYNRVKNSNTEGACIQEIRKHVKAAEKHIGKLRIKIPKEYEELLLEFPIYSVNALAQEAGGKVF